MKLRRATLADADRLRAWRNDPVTRQMSHRMARVSVLEHRHWLEQTLADPACLLYVAEDGGVPVGTIRADREGFGVELSWTVAPEHRRKGLGAQMLKLLTDMIVGPFRAGIKTDNVASRRMVERCGFRLSEIRNGVMVYERR